MAIHAALQRAPIDAGVALRDRVLVAVNANDAIEKAATIAATPNSGLVVVDRIASRLVPRLKHLYGSALTVATDPATYVRYQATTDRPMDLPAILDSPEMSLNEYMQAQLANGQDIAFMPVGRIQNMEILEAVITAANDVDATNMVLPIAIPAALLTDPTRRDLVARLKQSRHVVALIVTGEFDPFADRATARGLRDIAHDVAIFAHRTDFAAFEAVTHGGLGGSIGWCTRLRHAVAGRLPAKTRKKPPDRTPVVMVPDIDSYRHTAIIEPWFRNSAPPMCATPGCCGRDLSLLRDTRADHSIACEHNVRSWMSIAENLLAQPHSQRSQWLHSYRVEVAMRYEYLRKRTGVMTIDMDASQQTWLSLGQ